MCIFISNAVLHCSLLLLLCLPPLSLSLWQRRFRASCQGQVCSRSSCTSTGACRSTEVGSSRCTGSGCRPSSASRTAEPRLTTRHTFSFVQLQYIGIILILSQLSEDSERRSQYKPLANELARCRTRILLLLVTVRPHSQARASYIRCMLVTAARRLLVSARLERSAARGCPGRKRSTSQRSRGTMASEAEREAILAPLRLAVREQVRGMGGEEGMIGRSYARVNVAHVGVRVPCPRTCPLN